MHTLASARACEQVARVASEAPDGTLASGASCAANGHERRRCKDRRYFLSPPPKITYAARTCVLNAGAARCVERALPTWAEAPQPIANTQGALSGRERVGSCTAGGGGAAEALRFAIQLEADALRQLREASSAAARAVPTIT